MLFCYTAKMTISSKRILKILFALNFTFLAVHLLTYFFVKTDSNLIYQTISRLNIDNEVSIPTWFAQSLLLICSSLFFYTGLIAKNINGQFKKTWFFLAGLFLFASIDEGSSLHELLTEPFQEILSINSGLFFFAWVIPGIIIFSLLCISLIKFFTHLPRNTKIIFGLAATSLFLAICTEMISGMYWQASGIYESPIYPILNVLEEGFENTSFILTIYGLLNFISKRKIEDLPKISFVK